MLQNYTVKYIKIDSGYMGQVIEWPEIISEGKDIEECHYMIIDAIRETTAAYKQLGKEIKSNQMLHLT
jgi:predicted RNase H-like HicB family nuclease